MPAKKDNEIQIIRIYDAPVKAVWDAWVDPKQAAKWWGPRGFTITTHSKDFKPGGVWHYTMHGPDGVDYPNKTLYLEIEKHAKIVYDHGGYDDRPPLFRVTVYFSDYNGKTKMDMTMALATAQAAKDTSKFIKQVGGNATWDRLAEYLGEEVEHKDKFVINRSFQAPVDLVYNLWTDPQHFQNWLPPTGFTMNILEGSIKAGSGIFYKMGNGTVTMYGKVEYQELSKPHRLVYVQQFSDEKGNMSRHPFAPLWPEKMLTVVTLAEEGPNETRVTVEWQPHGNATPAEVAAFLKERGGMTQGWTGSFDKLDDYLEKHNK